MTNDDTLGDKMARLRTHGITRDPNMMVGESDGPWYYQQIELGYNYRMTDIQAALGASQITRLASYIDMRHTHRAAYDAELADLPITLPHQPNFQRSALHLYPILVQDDAPLDRKAAFIKLRELVSSALLSRPWL